MIAKNSRIKDKLVKGILKLKGVASCLNNTVTILVHYDELFYKFTVKCAELVPSELQLFHKD